MPNPLELSIQSAVKANDLLGDLFAKIGTSEHPYGVIMMAYRNAKRAMASALDEQNRLTAAGEVMRGLRATIRTEVAPLFQKAQELGIEQAQRQLRFYDIASASFQLLPMALSSQSQGALNALLAKVDAQSAQVDAMLVADLDTTLIIGDEDREGILRSGQVLADACFWLSALTWDAWSYIVDDSSQSTKSFKKQAIAALDRRTTECCLRVHGQIQPLDKPFLLDGSPCYSTELDWPPFHAWCRTSVALYLPEFDDGFTARMEESADIVLDERSKGIFKDRHPADAFASS